MYPPDWNSHNMADNHILAIVEKLGHSVSNSTATRGDLLLFQIGKKCIDHLGIYLGNNEFVHARVIKNKVQRSLLRGSPWFTRWKYTYRIDVHKVEIIDARR